APAVRTSAGTTKANLRIGFGQKDSLNEPSAPMIPDTAWSAATAPGGRLGVYVRPGGNR
ncbi:MAG: hypothetical protein JWL86_4607, partial [Rhizobium sp.]|nr:hypothetical protein [Rhizobium sp.]